MKGLLPFWKSGNQAGQKPIHEQMSSLLWLFPKGVADEGEHG